MFLFKKIALVLVLGAIGVLTLGILPDRFAGRLTRALVIIFIVGFAVRVGAYLLQ